MTDQKNKPVLDERTFEKLLEAAHVLQEHGRKMRNLEAIMESERRRERESASEAARPASQSEDASRINGDYTLTLAEIVEAQRQIQMRHLELDQTLAIIAERVANITGANGAGIAILDGKRVRYRAGAGPSALPVGSEGTLKTAICAASVRTGQVIRSEDVNTEVLFDPEPCRHRGIGSLVAVPIYQDGGIVGGLEIYFGKIHGYAEQDIHTCQLMAGLVTEALGREAGLALEKSMAAERSTMLAAMERLQPKATASDGESAASFATNGNAGAVPAISSCRNCGNELMAEEQFCGKCGSPQAVGREQEASHQTPVPASGNEWEEPQAVPAELFAASTDDAMAASLSSGLQAEESLEQNQDGVEVSATALVKPEQENIVWSSAAKAREFLESLSEPRSPGALARYWHSRRGDFYLAFAVILVLCVIRWGIWSNQPVSARGNGTAVSGRASRRKPAPDTDLSAFDKLLVGLGLAEAPEAPEYRGNPDTQVWLDLQTALYYCPGSDFYGKTAKGKLATQRDAQLDQFEPAYRKACN